MIYLPMIRNDSVFEINITVGKNRISFSQNRAKLDTKDQY